ncbi:hypothetical protein [Spiroplasma endosymbiont of Panorpa germanica]|uniref:hypothetical protein n=1 Tax=Spiroplasma endosymbiont of Panorpa germanica TaxID=3066314 RepID=UPI0030CD96BE
MRLTKTLNWIQIFLKSTTTVLLIVFLLVKIFVFKETKWFDILIAVIGIIILVFLIEAAVEFPISQYSSSLATIPLSFLFWHWIKPKEPKIISDLDQKKSLEPTCKEKISENRLKISYLIASLTIKAFLNVIFITVLIKNFFDVYWVVTFIILFTASIVIDAILMSRYIKNLVKKSKSLANLSIVQGV